MNVRRIFRLIAMLALAALAVTSIAGCTTRVVTAPDSAAINSVTSPGTGKVATTPDEATMNFGANTTSADAQQALDKASRIATRITEALIKQGVDKKDIQTSGVSLYPQQASRAGKIKVIGYEASISVDVKLRNLAKVGAAITAASDAGATTINGPSFGISEDSEFRAQAIEKAVADARTSAQAMAKAAGRSVGEVISISSSNVDVPRQFNYADSALASEAGRSVPIEPGQLDVTAEVTVVFELK